jgi:hypothetical protein
MQNEIMYGFVNDQNLLLNTAICYEGDTETIERVKAEFNADKYYAINIERDVIVLNESYWDGSKFFIPEETE